LLQGQTGLPAQYSERHQQPAGSMYVQQATTVCPSFAGYDTINGSVAAPTHVPTTFWAFTPAGNPAFPHAPPTQKLADI